MKLKEIFTIPNILSMFRIILIPFIIVAYFSNADVTCAILIVISALTDVVDGFIARRFNMISALGKALDPLADKLTLAFVLLCISIEFPHTIPLLVIFVVKEVLMGIEGLYIVKYTGTTYSAKWYGKISTVLMYATIMLFILFPDLDTTIEIVLIVLNILIIITSFILYSKMNLGRIKEIKKGKINE
ncbi:MAG: CDP-alcohol phosphatidyltransferase family protein [Clostridia bacterium]|nr:CDP-alcohol phosphatidyltransferase family protein [Clostridia bacterium]